MKRYLLRSLLIASALAAVLLAVTARQALTQKRGRDWVASQNGHVTFARKYDAARDEYDHHATPMAPDWMVRLLGIDLFDTVDTVVLDNTLLADLEPITDLHNLRKLGVFIEIDDDLSFEPLAELPKLRHVHLDYTNISADRLAALRKLLPDARVDATNHPPPPAPNGG